MSIDKFTIKRNDPSSGDDPDIMKEFQSIFGDLFNYRKSSTTSDSEAPTNTNSKKGTAQTSQLREGVIAPIQHVCGHGSFEVSLISGVQFIRCAKCGSGNSTKFTQVEVQTDNNGYITKLIVSDAGVRVSGGSGIIGFLRDDPPLRWHPYYKKADYK